MIVQVTLILALFFPRLLHQPGTAIDIISARVEQQIRSDQGVRDAQSSGRALYTLRLAIGVFSFWLQNNLAALGPSTGTDDIDAIA